MDKLGINTKIIDPKEIISLYNNGEFDDTDIMLFYGWSWTVPAEIVRNKRCICLHPSPLPKYRGGSPIQHQIINGENESAVSLFQMTEKLDSGPVYKQKSFPLDGHLSDIIKKIGEIGLAATIEMLDELAENLLLPPKQDESKATVFKRRKKSESELTEEKLKAKGSLEIFNFVRALEDPYPNAYINLKDGLVFLRRVEMARNRESHNALPILNLKGMAKADLNDLLRQALILKCADGRNIELKDALVKGFEN